MSMQEKLLYGLVGAVVGAISTYVVMDYLHEKELDGIYDELNGYRESRAAAALDKYQGNNIVELHNHIPADANQLRGVAGGSVYTSGPDVVGIRVTDEAGEPSCTHDVPLTRPCALCAEIVKDDAKAEEVLVVCAHGVPINQPCLMCDGVTFDEEPPVGFDDAHEPVEDEHFLHPHGDEFEDPESIQAVDELPEETEAADSNIFAERDKVSEVVEILPNDQVRSGHQIVGKFDRDNGSFKTAKSESIAHPDLDEVIENDTLYSLIGEEAWNTVMDSEPQEESRMIHIRNHVMDIDFVILY